MKKLGLGYIILFMLLFSFEVKSQQVHSLWISAVPGFNSNWILNQNAYGNQEFEYASRFGLSGGLGVTYFYRKHWGFNSSFLLSQMGQNYSGYQAGGVAERKIKLSYLEVPLLFMRELPYMQYPTWVSFGPDVLILLNANQKYARNGGNPLPNPEGMIDGNVKDRYKPIDIAVNFAVNRMYNLDYFRKMMFLFSANSTIGLTDINTTDWQIPNKHNIYKGSHNFYIGLKVGIMFKVARLSGHHW